MSIRQIAIDLYALEKELSRLKKELADAPPEKFQSVQEQINQATLERNKLKGMLEAKKKG
jgi:hypothetical protein